MKKTAVEWLIEIFNITNVKLSHHTLIIEQAKEMEKEQIIETWHNGYNNQSPMIDEENCGQQYYKETFKNKT